MGTGSSVVRPSTTPVDSQLKTTDSSQKTVTTAAQPRETRPALRTIWQRQAHAGLPAAAEKGAGNRAAVELDPGLGRRERGVALDRRGNWPPGPHAERLGGEVDFDVDALTGILLVGVEQV